MESNRNRQSSNLNNNQQQKVQQHEVWFQDIRFVIAGFLGYVDAVLALGPNLAKRIVSKDLYMNGSRNFSRDKTDDKAFFPNIIYLIGATFGGLFSPLFGDDNTITQWQEDERAAIDAELALINAIDENYYQPWNRWLYLIYTLGFVAGIFRIPVDAFLAVTKSKNNLGFAGALLRAFKEAFGSLSAPLNTGTNWVLRYLSTSEVSVDAPHDDEEQDLNARIKPRANYNNNQELQEDLSDTEEQEKAIKQSPSHYPLNNLSDYFHVGFAMLVGFFYGVFRILPDGLDAAFNPDENEALFKSFYSAIPRLLWAIPSSPFNQILIAREEALCSIDKTREEKLKAQQPPRPPQDLDYLTLSAYALLGFFSGFLRAFPTAFANTLFQARQWDVKMSSGKIKRNEDLTSRVFFLVGRFAKTLALCPFIEARDMVNSAKTSIDRRLAHEEQEAMQVESYRLQGTIRVPVYGKPFDYATGLVLAGLSSIPVGLLSLFNASGDLLFGLPIGNMALNFLFESNLPEHVRQSPRTESMLINTLSSPLRFVKSVLDDTFGIALILSGFPRTTYKYEKLTETDIHRNLNYQHGQQRGLEDDFDGERERDVDNQHQQDHQEPYEIHPSQSGQQGSNNYQYGSNRL